MIHVMTFRTNRMISGNKEMINMLVKKMVLMDLGDIVRIRNDNESVGEIM